MRFSLVQEFWIILCFSVQFTNFSRIFHDITGIERRLEQIFVIDTIDRRKWKILPIIMNVEPFQDI